MHYPAHIKQHDHGEQNQGHTTQPVHIKMVQLVRLNMHSPQPHSQVHPLRQRIALVSTASPGALSAMGLMLVILPSTDRFSSSSLGNFHINFSTGSVLEEKKNLFVGQKETEK